MYASATSAPATHVPRISPRAGSNLQGKDVVVFSGFRVQGSGFRVQGSGIRVTQSRVKPAEKTRCYQSTTFVSQPDISCRGTSLMTGSYSLVAAAEKTWRQGWRRASLETTRGQIFCVAPTDATRFWWHLYGS